MSKFALLPLRLKELYGLKKLHVFYPDIYPNAHCITCREVIDLYDHCHRMNDTEAIELLRKNWDLEAIFDFDRNFHKEKSVNREFRMKEAMKHRDRKKDVLSGRTKNRYVGGTYYRDVFYPDGNGGYMFNTRRCFYRMPLADMQTLFDMSAAGVSVTANYKDIETLYDLFQSLPDKKELILFYLQYLASRPFPVWEYEEIRDGIIKLA